MKLYIVRHTKVDSPKGICYGQTDVGLADSFEEEADRVFEKIKDIAFNYIFSSPLSRCVRLANEVVKNPQHIVYDKRLMELNFGDWENQHWNSIYKTKEAKVWFKDYINTPCPNGESFMDLADRVEDFIKDLKQKEQHTNVLIFCHGGVIRAFNSLINKLDINSTFELKVEYGQILELEL